MKVELFQAAACKNCAARRDALRSITEQAALGIEWRDVDINKELDYAVELGVTGLPALAIDGELVFRSLPAAAQLKEELVRRVRGSASHGS